MIKIRHSAQRDSILSSLVGRKDHPTADMVYSVVKKEYPKISLGTVYRNLSLLSELGEIQKINAGDGVDHFDADISDHCHMVCRKCGGVSDVFVKNSEIIDLSTIKYDGKIERSSTCFYGLCSKCCN